MGKRAFRVVTMYSQAIEGYAELGWVINIPAMVTRKWLGLVGRLVVAYIELRRAQFQVGPLEEHRIAKLKHSDPSVAAGPDSLVPFSISIVVG